MSSGVVDATAKRRKSGIPTGNAGEYFVMGELLRQGFDAQLADRNTKGYDLLIGRVGDRKLSKIQVKTVRAQPWYVNTDDFDGSMLDQITIYVLLGPEKPRRPIRYFIARNRDLAECLHRPPDWKKSAFMQLKNVTQYEDNWSILNEYNAL